MSLNLYEELTAQFLLRMTNSSKKHVWVIQGHGNKTQQLPGPPSDDDNTGGAAADWMHPQPSNKPTPAPTVSAAPTRAPTPPPTHVPNPFALSDGGGGNPFG